MSDNNATFGDSMDSEYGQNTSAKLEPGQVLGGKYRLEKRAGRGGMGEVWKAFDTIGERWVALKFVPRDVQRFEHELQRVKETFKSVHALNHQYICPVYALEEDSVHGYYLVMKWLEGQTLDEIHRQKAKDGGRLPIQYVPKLISCVAEALDFAHKVGVIHRDVKPTNIFIKIINNQIKEVNLIDFGLASEIRESMTRVSQIQVNTCGTRPYMPPEQWRGRKQDARTDQYSLAVVAYELYAGHLPFSGEDTEMLRLAVLQDPPERIEGIPDSINAALQKALSKDRMDRYSSCMEFMNAISGGITRKTGKNPFKFIIRSFVFGLLVILVTVITVWFYQKTPRSENNSSPKIENSNLNEAGKTAGEKKTLTVKGIDYTFCWCPSGSFQMGSPESEEGHQIDEKQHRVTLSHGFWMLENEVTVGMYRQFVEETGHESGSGYEGKGGCGYNSDTNDFEWGSQYTWRDNGFSQGENHPVANVDWNDAVAFCDWLSQKSGHKIALPTEAQWEYACRAGSKTAYNFGIDPDGLSKVGNVGDSTAKMKFSDWSTINTSDGYVFSSPIKSFQPNAWGLYDMYGNVWEWCSDWYSSDYYENSPGTDPPGPTSGSHRVLRGGCWDNLAVICRSANRGGIDPSSRSDGLGFRLTLVPASR